MNHGAAVGLVTAAAPVPCSLLLLNASYWFLPPFVPADQG